MEIHELLRDRRSPRAIDPNKPVDKETVHTLIEAFRWAPSSFNRQPWRLVVVRDKSTQGKIHEVMSERNKMWVPKAPVLIVVLGNPEEQDKPDGRDQYLVDCGLGIENMLLQGNALGLAIHATVGWKEEPVRKALQVPDPFRAVAVVAVGHPGRAEDLPEPLQQSEKAPRSRKEAKDLVFYERFGNPAT